MACMDGRAWLGMSRKDFDQDASDVQQALFVVPDPLGTPDMVADHMEESDDR